MFCFFFPELLTTEAADIILGALEQAITSHPQVTEACVVGIPDSLKGQLPFAFVVSSPDGARDGGAHLLPEIQRLVRTQVGPIASLGGMISTATTARPIIPKTRTGKTLRRVLKELLENAVHGESEKGVSVPSTVEDGSVVESARLAVTAYFEGRKGVHKAIESRVKL